MFGLHYENPETIGAFADSYVSALGRSGPSMIEVRTSRDANHELHRRLEAELVAALK